MSGGFQTNEFCIDLDQASTMRASDRTSGRGQSWCLLGGAAVLWPHAAIAQMPTKVYRIGLLSGGVPVADASPYGVALVSGLAQLGYALGRNMEFERRGAEGHLDRLPRLLDELAASKVDVVVAVGYPRRLSPNKRSRFQWWRSRPARARSTWRIGLVGIVCYPTLVASGLAPALFGH
jgi:hypothetical protein